MTKDKDSEGSSAVVDHDGGTQRPTSVANPEAHAPCPKCGGSMWCPCEHCAPRNVGRPLWIWIDGEVIKCPHCGHAGHADYWLDQEWAHFKGREFKRIVAAARAVYYAAHWTPDRPCNEGALWTELRDACGFEPGHAPTRHQLPVDSGPPTGAAEGHVETSSSVAVGAPGSGGLKARLDAIATKLNGATADTALEVTKWALPRIADLAADAIEAAEQQEARAERLEAERDTLAAALMEKNRDRR